MQVDGKFFRFGGLISPREVSLEGPEIHHPHARHGGLPRWLELGIGLYADLAATPNDAVMAALAARAE